LAQLSSDPGAGAGSVADFLARLEPPVYRRPMERHDRYTPARTTEGQAEQNELAGGPRSPGPPAQSRWLNLLASIRAIQMELKRHDPSRAIGLSGNPSAPDSALVVTELRLGRKLPPSYREFLAFSDGWSNFFNGASLLGTGELGRTGFVDAHASVLARGRLLAFGADRTGSTLFAFDTSIRLGDGELGVVAWVGGLGIDCRCFTSFLATILQLCRAELSALKASELPESPSAQVERDWLYVG
jgi:SMI1/KNR4 family protein SUKH-1